MATYLLVIIWLIGAAICYYIARVRRVNPNLFWSLVILFLGPFAIPLISLTRPRHKTAPNSE